MTERFAQERWLKVESLFLAATALPPAREHFLEQECLGDAALRTEAESLLPMDAVAARELTAVIEGAAAAFFCEEPLEGALTRTGASQMAAGEHPEALKVWMRRPRSLTHSPRAGRRTPRSCKYSLIHEYKARAAGARPD